MSLAPVIYGPALKKWRLGRGWTVFRASLWYGCEEVSWRALEARERRPVPLNLTRRIQELDWQERWLGYLGGLYGIPASLLTGTPEEYGPALDEVRPAGIRSREFVFVPLSDPFLTHGITDAGNSDMVASELQLFLHVRTVRLENSGPDAVEGSDSEESAGRAVSEAQLVNHGASADGNVPAIDPYTILRLLDPDHLRLLAEACNSVLETVYQFGYPVVEPRVGDSLPAPDVPE